MDKFPGTNFVRGAVVRRMAVSTEGWSVMIRAERVHAGAFLGLLGLRGLGATLLVAVGLSACAADGATIYSMGDIADRAPSGMLGGATWSMQAAVVTVGDEELRVSLFPIEVDGCESRGGRPKLLRFDVPRMEGEYPLDLDFSALAERQTITFVTAPGRNVVATEGLIVVEALDDETVTLGLVADAGDGNYMNGRLTATLCDH